MSLLIEESRSGYVDTTRKQLFTGRGSEETKLDCTLILEFQLPDCQKLNVYEMPGFCHGWGHIDEYTGL